MIVRDQANQKQDVSTLSRDTDHANGSIDPIFNKEKEQKRLQTAQMIGEIGNQVADIARTNGKIAATEAANEKMKTAGSDARNAAISQLKKDGKEVTDQAIHDQMYQTFYNEAFNQSGMGTGQSTQRAITAATAAIQALAGGDIKAAIAGGAAPYIANAIANAIPEKDLKGRVLAHAVVNAALAAASGRDAASAAAGAAVGELAGKIAVDGFGKQVSELSEEEKQAVSALATLASGLAGGLVGDSSANAVAAAQAGKTTVENNYLSQPEKTELEIAKQTLKNSKDPAEREKAQQKYDALIEKNIASDKDVIDACGNGNAGSSACAGARLKVIATKEGYEDGPYNSKYSQQYADAYGQIVNLLDITSVDAQNQQQVKDAMINYFMVTKGVDRQTAESYTETKQGLEIIAASVTPILGSAAAKQLSKVVDANLKVVAKGNVDGVKFSDTNQGIRPSQLADFNKPTLINDVVQAKIDKRPDKNYPNGNMGTAHAEVGVIQQAFDKGMTQGREMTMSVGGKEVCNYCLSDVRVMAEKAGLKSLTIYEETTDNVLFWQQGMKKIENRGPAK
ncbi:TPA: VENN motif pre-toxin domain-containing protein [Enterobacter roggenkampii]|nr:VENN motif pre-toxin domain-containing protein [Enterobacter roggenkampii]